MVPSYLVLSDCWAAAPCSLPAVGLLPAEEAHTSFSEVKNKPQSPRLDCVVVSASHPLLFSVQLQPRLFMWPHPSKEGPAELVL